MLRLRIAFKLSFPFTGCIVYLNVGALAQLVEQLPLKQPVTGSNPVRITIEIQTNAAEGCVWLSF